MTKVSYKSAPLTTDGGANGILAVADTSGFVKGAKVFLGASGLPTVELEIAVIKSPTELGVKLKSSPSARYDSSGFTTALGATLVQPEQDVFSSTLTRVATIEPPAIPSTPNTLVLRNNLGGISAARGDFTSLYVGGSDVVTNTPAFQAAFTPKTRCQPLTLEDWRAGATAPGHATFGSNPRKSGWEYTAAGAGNQEMELYTRVPYDLNSGAGVNVLLSILLTTTETVGDSCNFQLQYVTTQSANDDGSGALTGLATIATGALTVGLGKNAAGTLYKVRIPLDPTDANNPFTGDNYTIAMGLKRTAGTVGTVLLLGACIEYTSKI